MSVSKENQPSGLQRNIGERLSSVHGEERAIEILKGLHVLAAFVTTEAEDVREDVERLVPEWSEELASVADNLQFLNDLAQAAQVREAILETETQSRNE